MPHNGFIKEVKRWDTEQEEMFTNRVPDKGLVSRTRKKYNQIIERLK